MGHRTWSVRLLMGSALVVLGVAVVGLAVHVSRPVRGYEAGPRPPRARHRTSHPPSLGAGTSTSTTAPQPATSRPTAPSSSTSVTTSAPSLRTSAATGTTAVAAELASTGASPWTGLAGATVIALGAAVVWGEKRTRPVAAPGATGGARRRTARPHRRQGQHFASVSTRSHGSQWSRGRRRPANLGGQRAPAPLPANRSARTRS
jgi:hypothetical protein